MAVILAFQRKRPAQGFAFDYDRSDYLDKLQLTKPSQNLDIVELIQANGRRGALRIVFAVRRALKRAEAAEWARGTGAASARAGPPYDVNWHLSIKVALRRETMLAEDMIRMGYARQRRAA